jgi:hypothetical protein
MKRNEDIPINKGLGSYQGLFDPMFAPPATLDFNQSVRRDSKSLCFGLYTV